MVHRDSVRTKFQSLRVTSLPVSARTPETIAAERRWSERLIAGLTLTPPASGRIARIKSFSPIPTATTSSSARCPASRLSVLYGWRTLVASGQWLSKNDTYGPRRLRQGKLGSNR